jgi:hypothetical protein
LVDSLEPGRIQARLAQLRADIRRCVEAMPAHWDFIQGRDRRKADCA